MHMDADKYSIILVFNDLSNGGTLVVVVSAYIELCSLEVTL